jgi:hypothetical protein
MSLRVSGNIILKRSTTVVFVTQISLFNIDHRIFPSPAFSDNVSIFLVPLLTALLTD